MKPIRSMTGFASAASTISPDLKVELKSVNNRFLDVSCRLPPGAEKYDQPVSKKLREKLSRGRIDVLVRREIEKSQKQNFNFHKTLFDSALNEIMNAVSIQGLDKAEQLKLVTASLLEKKEFISFDYSDEENLISEEGLFEALDLALSALIKMREVEGQNLKTVLLAQLKEIKDFTTSVQPFVTQALEKFSNRVTAKLQELELTIPADRLALEVAILAERSDVSEELDRLKSHVLQFEAVLSEGGEVGKKLDFLIQEMNREVNTTGSKSQSGDVTKLVINAKSCLEKIREQIQNIE